MLRSTDHVCKFKERYHAGVPGEPPAPRVYIYIASFFHLQLIGKMGLEATQAYCFGGADACVPGWHQSTTSHSLAYF